MNEKLLAFCNDMLDGLKVTPEQIERVGGADGFAHLVASSLINNDLRLAEVEQVKGEASTDGP